jgi:hypothetical protein
VKLTEPASFTLPKKPRVKVKDTPPDQRKLSVLPIRAGNDSRLHGSTLRCLIVLCSYCNRAGLTWVGQAKLAQDLQVSRQAVTKQIKLLIQTGYVEVVKKGFRGEKTNTLRVIYDPTIDAETAISITSTIEDNRPPTMKDDIPDPAGQRRVQALITQALKSSTTTKKEYQMPKDNETATVKKMKQEIIKKTTQKRSHKQPPEVANQEAPEVANNTLHRQPDRLPPEVATNGKERVYKEYLKVDSIKTLLSSGLSEKQIEDNLEVLLEVYRAEGIKPNPARLVDEIMQLARDAG